MSQVDPERESRRKPILKRWGFWALAVPGVLLGLVTAMNVTAWRSYVAACEAYEHRPSWDYLTRPFGLFGKLVDPDRDEEMQLYLPSESSLGHPEAARLYVDPLDPFARYVEWDVDGRGAKVWIRLVLTGSGWRARGFYHIGQPRIGLSREARDRHSFDPARWIPAWKF